MSAKAYKTHIATEAASRKREKLSKTEQDAHVPTPDHTERDDIVARLKKRKPK